MTSFSNFLVPGSASHYNSTNMAQRKYKTKPTYYTGVGKWLERYASRALSCLRLFLLQMFVDALVLPYWSGKISIVLVSCCASTGAGVFCWVGTAVEWLCCQSSGCSLCNVDGRVTRLSSHFHFGMHVGSESMWIMFMNVISCLSVFSCINNLDASWPWLLDCQGY